MKNTISILLLLITPLAIMSYSCANSKPENVVIDTSILQQYVGEYMYDAEGVIINIYTKEKENDTRLYFSSIGEGEIELIALGEHQFSFKTEEEIKIEFKKAENGVFNELRLIQPDETLRAPRLEIEDLATIDKKLMEKDFSGVILIAQNDSILFNKAYGRKNSQENGMNDLNTVFDICSISKQFTGAGILKLSMQNKLSVNDKISKYFDAVPTDKKDITIHQLLTHSSGLVAGIGGDYDTITESAFLRQVFNSELVSPIGTAFNYSNMGYSLLALIIEKASGMDYEAFLNEAIFKPSKMYHTGYVIPDWNQNEIANCFVDRTEAKQPNEENWNEKGPYLNLKGNGGILTRASDLLLWSQAIRNHTVLDQATTSDYLYPHFDYNDGRASYGYGWGIVNNDLEDKLVRHAGMSELSTSDVWMYPNKEITIILLSNKAELRALTIAKRISKFLLAE